MPSPARAPLHRSAAIAPAGQSRDADEDDAGLIRRPRLCDCGGTECAAPRALDRPAPGGHLQRSGLRDGFDEAMRLRPSASFLDAGDSWVWRGPFVSFAIAG